MTNDEAKILLQSLHEGALPESDPRVNEALARAWADPDLLDWFQKQQAFDAVIADKLREINPPPDLAEKILRKRPPLRRRRPISRYQLALAAAVAICLALPGLLLGPGRTPPTEIAAVQADMIEYLQTFPTLDQASGSWPAITTWLSSREPAAATGIPPSFQRYPGLGCREIPWRGQKLLLICLAAEGEFIHLIVVPGKNSSGGAKSAAPDFSRNRGWNSASWTVGEIRYLSLTKGSQNLLRRLVSEAFPRPN